jgi:hypothetical protein
MRHLPRIRFAYGSELQKAALREPADFFRKQHHSLRLSLLFLTDEVYKTSLRREPYIAFAKAVKI